MKPINQMTQGELAAFIDSHLRKSGITVVLSGGACVAIYSDYKYVSKDLDFIGKNLIDHKNISLVMKEIGFYKEGKYYFHPDSQFFVEFISGPLSIGEDPINDIRELEFSTGIVRIISPTESIKDRLAAYYYWNDIQSLEQAILIANNQEFDINNIKKWSIKEGKGKEFSVFKDRIS